MTTETTPAGQSVKDEVRAMVAAGSPAFRAMAERVNAEAAERKVATAEMLKIVQGSGAKWLKGAKPEQVQAFASVCVALDLSPIGGDAYLIHGMLYLGIQGRRTLAVRTGQRRSESQPRMLAPGEKTLHGVEDGDVARSVEVWRKGEDAPHVGIGVIRASEITKAQDAGRGDDGVYYLPLAKDPPFMAAKRAAMAAYRKAFPELMTGTDNETDPQESQGIEITDLGAVDASEPERREIEGGDLLAPLAGEVDPETGEITERPTDITTTVDGEGVGADGPTVASEAETAAASAALTEGLAKNVERVVAEIVWGEWDADKDYAIAAVLGCHAAKWLEGGFSVEDAAEVAQAVHGAMTTPPGRNLADAASLVHRTRSEAGLPFLANMILEEDADGEAG